MFVFQASRSGSIHGCIPAILLVTALALHADGPPAPSWSRHLAAAGALQHTGDFAGAAAEFDKALAGARALGPDNPSLAHVLDDMGDFYSAIGDFARAEPLLQESLRIWRQSLDAGNLALVRPLNRLAAAYIESGDLGKLVRLNLPVWIERMRPASFDRDEFVRLLQNVAMLESTMGHFERAQSLFQDALRQAGPAADLSLRSSLLNNFGLACLRAGRYDAAIECLSTAAQMWPQPRGFDVVVAATIDCNLALAYNGRRRYTEAEERMRMALDLFERSLGVDNIRTASVMAAYAHLLAKLHRKAEAKRLSAQAAEVIEEQKSKIHSAYTVDVTDLSLRSGKAHE